MNVHTPDDHTHVWWSLEPTYMCMIIRCVNVHGLVWGQCMCHSTWEIVIIYVLIENQGRLIVIPL